MPLFDSAGPGQIWSADRHFCTRTILQRCHEAGASFIARQHSKHSVIVHEGLYRRRWSIEGMFGRLESVLHSEIPTLGHPRAAWLGFTVVVLAYNLLSLLKRCVEHAHRQEAPQLDVSTYHMAQHVRGAYEGLLIAVPPAHWPNWAPQDTDQVV